MNTLYQVEFQGQTYLLDKDYETNGTPLATAEQRASFTTAFAHVYPDGTIKRYGKQIGTTAELKFLGEIETPTPTVGYFEGLSNILDMMDVRSIVLGD